MKNVLFLITMLFALQLGAKEPPQKVEPQKVEQAAQATEAVQDSQIEKTVPETLAGSSAVVIDSQIIGGEKYYVLAELIDSTYQNIRIVAAKIKADPPKNLADWWLLIVSVLGVVTSLSSQIIRVWAQAKSLIDKMPKGEPIVALVSLFLGFGWLYVDTHLDNFTIRDLFFRTAGIFFFGVIAYRVFLSLRTKKPETTPTAKA